MTLMSWCLPTICR